MDRETRELLKDGLRPVVREDAQRRLAKLEVQLAASGLTRMEIIDRAAAGLEPAIGRAKKMVAPDFPDSERMQVIREVITEVLAELRKEATN